MKKIILILSTTSLCLVFSCKKQNQTPTQEETTTTNNNNGTNGFTAPTNNYYKIDDSTNTVSADVVHCDMNGGYVSLSKNFTNINIQPSQLSLTFDSLGSTTNRQIRNQISEGGYKMFTIDTVNYKDSDKKFNLYRTVFKKGNADKINNSTNDITNICLNDIDKKCNIKSPSISKKGYTIVGWDTDSSASSSIWKANTSKDIDGSNTYYDILFTDTGNIGSEIDPTLLLYIGGEEISAKAMTQKDKTLFLGNIEIKRKEV